MSITPLFFLPRDARIWAFNQAMEERLLNTPFGALFWSADRFGIEFWYRGDTVIWTWPWTRREREGDNRGKAPFISLGFSGNGDFGDARYWTLKELREDWYAYGKVSASCVDAIQSEIERRCVETLMQSVVEATETTRQSALSVEELTKAVEAFGKETI